MSERGLKILIGKNILPGLKSLELNFYEHCIYGKQRRVLFMRGCHERKMKILEFVGFMILCMEFDPELD